MKIVLIMLFMVTGIFASNNCVKLKDDNNNDVYINISSICFINISNAAFDDGVIIHTINKRSICLHEKYSLEKILKLLNWEIING